MEVSIQKETGFYSLISDKTRDFAGRGWLFSEIKSWLADPYGPRYFLITGKAGTGKSAISARLWQISEGVVKDENLEKGFLSAIHVCSRRDARSLNPIEFSESIANELSKRYEDFRNELIEISTKYVKDLSIDVSQKDIQAERVFGASVTVKVTGSPDPNYIFQTLVWNPLERIIQNSNQKIVFLIDGLDESFVTFNSNSILSLISSIETLPSNIRFVITSRDNDYIKDRLSKDGNVISLSEEYYKNSNKDILEYVNLRIKNESKLTNHYVGFVDDLTTKAEDNFLYATFVLNAIVEDKLELTKESLDKIPPFLDGLYHEFLYRISGNDLAKWNNELKFILTVLSVAYKGLNQSQLAFLTGIDPLKIYVDILELKSFIRFTNTHNEYQSSTETEYKLYHQSLTDFLFLKTYKFKRPDGIEKDSVNLFYIEEQEAHRTIAEKYYSFALNDFNLDSIDVYGLRYLSYHLSELTNYRDYRGINWYEKFIKLAKNENIEIKQLEYFRIEPDVNVVMKKQAFIASLQADDSISSVEMVLVYMDKLNKLSELSPLDVLKNISYRPDDEVSNDRILKKSWMIADLSSPEMTCSWYLLICWALENKKRNSDVKDTLSQLSQKEPNKLIFSNNTFPLIPYLFSSLYEKYPEIFSILKFMTAQDISSVCDYFIDDKNDLRGALEVSKYLTDYYRAIKLSRIAQVMAFTDVEQASNITDQIEEPDFSDYREEALIHVEIAKAIASLDKERAISIANKIEWADDRAKALLQIAQVVATTNKDKAENVLDEAIAAANKIEERSDRNLALTRIARVMAISDTDRAISFADKIKDSTDRGIAQLRMVQVIASTNTDLAISVTNKIVRPSTRCIALLQIAQAVATTSKDKAESLLDEAIAAANKIEDTMTKSITQSRIAQVIATTNRDKAEGLLDEAIAAANKMYLAAKLQWRYFHSRELLELAQAIAPTNSDKAENLLVKSILIASRIDYSSTKSRALSLIAEAIAFTDVEQASYIVDKIKDRYYINRPLSQIARAFAPTDVERAISLANKIDISNDRAEALSQIAQAIAPTDVDIAISVVDNNIEQRSIKSRTLSQIAQVIASTNIKRAVFIANRINMPDYRAKALLQIAQVIATSNKDNAESLLDEAIAAANRIGHTSTKSTALSQIAQVVATTNKDKAENVLDEAIAAANKLNPSTKSTALLQIAQVVATTNKDKAENVLDEAIAAANKIKTSYWDRNQALVNIAKTIASTNLERAITVANKIEQADDRAIALLQIAQVVATSNKDKAESLLDEAIAAADKIDYSSSKSTALLQIAQVIATTNKDKAESLLDEAIAAANLITESSTIGNTPYDRCFQKDGTLSQIAKIVVNNRFNFDKFTKVVDMITNPDRLCDIAFNSIEAPKQFWIHIIKQSINYPEIVYLICSIICLRNLGKSKDIVKLITEHQF